MDKAALTRVRLTFVELEEGKVWIATPRLQDLTDMNKAEQNGHGEMGGMLLLMARCIVDESGARLFEDSDADTIAQMPTSVATPIMEAVKAAAGIEDDEDAALGKSETTTT